MASSNINPLSSSQAIRPTQQLCISPVTKAKQKVAKPRLSEPFTHLASVDTKALREQGATTEPRRSQSSQPAVPPNFNKPNPSTLSVNPRLYGNRSLSLRGRGTRMFDCAAHMLGYCWLPTTRQQRRSSFSWQIEPPHFRRDEAHLIRALWPNDQTELFTLSQKLIENIFVAVPQTKRLFGADKADSMDSWFKTKQFRQQALAVVNIMTKTVTIYTMTVADHQEEERQRFEQRLRQFGKYQASTQVPFRDDDWVSVAATITDTVIEFARQRALRDHAQSSAISSHQQQQIDLTADLWRRLVEYVVAVMRNGWLQKSHPRRRFSIASSLSPADRLGENTSYNANTGQHNTEPDDDQCTRQQGQGGFITIELCDRLVTI